MRVFHEGSRGEIHRSVRIEDGPVIQTKPHSILPSARLKVTQMKVIFNLTLDVVGLPSWRCEEMVYVEGLIFEADDTLSDRSWKGWIPQTDWSRRITSWLHPGDLPSQSTTGALFIRSET